MGADDSMAFDNRHDVNCCEMICGRPSDTEPKCNMLFCNVSKRILKNMLMFMVVLLVYALFLSLIMGNRSRKQP